MDDGYFMDDEVTQDDLVEAWGNAEEANDPEDEDEQQAPGHPLSPATRPKFPEHLADPPPTTGSRPRGISSQGQYKSRGTGKCLSTKAAPPPPRARPCRPKEPPPQKPNHSPPNYLDMGGIFVGPPGYNASKEQRLKDWELSHKIGWQNFLNSYAKHEYVNDCSDED